MPLEVYVLAPHQRNLRVRAHLPLSRASEPDCLCHYCGCGPRRAYAAAISVYAYLCAVLFASSVSPGGALMNTTEVEISRRFIEGIPGPRTHDEYWCTTERFGTDIRYRMLRNLTLPAR